MPVLSLTYAAGHIFVACVLAAPQAHEWPVSVPMAMYRLWYMAEVLDGTLSSCTAIDAGQPAASWRPSCLGSSDDCPTSCQCLTCMFQVKCQGHGHEVYPTHLHVMNVEYLNDMSSCCSCKVTHDMLGESPCSFALLVSSFHLGINGSVGTNAA